MIVATAFALVAALGVFALLDGGGDGDGAPSGDESAASGDGYELTPQGELPGSTAEVRLESLTGQPDAALGDLLTGKPVVVNFFASWCAPCVEEMPAVEAVHQSLGDQVTIIGLANQDGRDDSLATVEATGVTYPTYADPDGSALTYFGGLGHADHGVHRRRRHGGRRRATASSSEAELRAKLTDLFGITA